ncbi:MAG: hypothetical protein PHQ35_10630 [Phycisphaerae bacterium]|nr:hypothetical protein [Phycisphaerae bacterium]
MRTKTIQDIGKKFAKWCNHQIEEMGLGLASGTPGSGNGKLKGDSYCNLPFLLEFKSERDPHWKGNIEQARREAAQGNWDKDKWVLVQRDPDTSQENPQAFAIMDYIEFLKLLKKNKEADPVIKTANRELKWKVKRFIDYGKSLLNELE